MYLLLSTTARQRRFAQPSMRISKSTAAMLAAKSDNMAISPFLASTKPAAQLPSASPKRHSESSSARSSAWTSPRDKHKSANHHPITAPPALPRLHARSRTSPPSQNQHATSSTRTPATTKHGEKCITARASSTNTSCSTKPPPTSSPNSAAKGIKRSARSETRMISARAEKNS